VAVALESWSLRTAVHEARPSRRPGQTWWRFIHTTKSPELPVVLLEDSGALLGLFFALTGLIVAEVTGNPRWDAVGSIAIGLLLVVIAFALAKEMKGLLIGEAASEEDQRAIEAAMVAPASVRGIIHVRTMHLGPDDILVAAKLEFDHELDNPELAVAIDEVERSIRAAVPIATTIYIEPDIRRSTAGA
jgi:divalent metal cation (Fe/Co/Zn/Cd) transporter